MPKTYSELYINARNELRDMGVQAAALEARLIVATASDKTTEQLLRDLRLYASNEMDSKVESMMARRRAGEPVAYVTGVWEFMGLPMEVSPEVLIPRVDTEVLAQEAVRLLTGRKQDARILDLCSGSGCIGCAIAKALPKSRIVLCDISEEAMAIARRNVERNGLDDRVSFVVADALEEPPMMLGSFDMIVSNPPYISTFDILGLDSSVRDYEPVWALDGGEDGLKFYRGILQNWRATLRTGAHVLFEVGEGQAEQVKDILLLGGFHSIAVLEDTGGVERVVRARV